MGDRGQVSVKGADVFFYDHWKCSRLAETVRAALVRAAGRLDPEYLARIVFCEMVRGEELETTGYGISAGPFGDTWRTVEITPPDVDQAHPAGRVRVLDTGLEGGVRRGEPARVVLDLPIREYAARTAIRLDQCPVCLAWSDLDTAGHVYEDGRPAGFRCGQCGRDLLYGRGGRLYTRGGPMGEAEEVAADGTTIDHETAAQTRTAAPRGDLP